jgi:FHA domain
MPLPIEVNHVLGKRSLTLAYRDVESPVVVGRGRECDVQIPSVTVGATHCMLFVHEGQWLLQEAPDCLVTVNGTPIAGPVALKIGDVIGVGPGEKAPTIQIDPVAAAAGKSGPAVETAGAGSVVGMAGPAVIGAAAKKNLRPPKLKPIAGEAPPQLSIPTPAAAPRRRLAQLEPPPQSEEYSHAEAPLPQHAAPADGDTIDFGQPVAGGSSFSYRRRKKEDSGAGMIVLWSVIVLGVLGGLIGLAWMKREEELAANQPPPPPPPLPAYVEPATQAAVPDGPVGPGDSIFELPGGKPKHPLAPPAPDPAPAPADGGSPDTPPAQTDTTAPAADAGATGDEDDDPDWLAVRTAHSSPDQGIAIIKFDSYRQQYPGKHTKELADFESYALEHLWWDRVSSLFDLRAKLDQQIEDKKTELSQQPNDAFHKTLEGELADLQQQRDTANQQLTGDMAYTLPTKPDVDDTALIGQLDAKRDPAMFAHWKMNTIAWIRQHNGVPPWADQ